MRRLFSIFLIGLLILFSGGMCIAAPMITSVSGSFDHQGSVTISGNAFGSKSPAAPLIWDNFEWGSDGDNIETDPGGDWTNHFDDNPASIDTDQKYGQGTRSAYNDAWQNGDWHQEYGFAWQDYVASSEVYFSYAWRWSTTSSYSANTKLGRGTSPPNHYDGCPSFGATYKYGVANIVHYNNATDWPSCSGLNYAYVDNSGMPKDTWNRVEMNWLASTPGLADGFLKYYIKLEKLTNWDAVMTRASGVTGLPTMVMIPLDHFDDHPGTVFHLWVDDFYLDNTRSRVEIGDNEDWASCTTREIQIPSAWSGTSITVTVNQGTFATNDTVYLFVVDSDGNPNTSGYPITIGGGDTNSPIIISPLPLGGEENGSIAWAR